MILKTKNDILKTTSKIRLELTNVTEKQKEYQRKVETEDDIINNLAQLIIQENEAMLGKDVAEKAKEKVRKERKTNVQEKTESK